MKKIFLHFLLILPITLSAQTLSIQDLWNKLSETNIAKQNQLDVKLANQDLNIERLNRFPVVYADANLQRNLITPTTPVPAIAFDPNAQDGAILPLRFATKWNAKAGVQAEWKFFDPNRKTTRTEKALLAEKAEVNQKLGKQNLKNEATLAYASIVLASLQYQAAVEDSIRFNQILQTSKTRFEAGRESSEQYLVALQENERKKIQLYETWSVLREADLELQKYIDLNNVEQLSSGIESIQKALQAYQKTNYDAELNTINLKINDNDYQSFKRQLLPSLTFNAYYGAQFYNNEFRLFNSNNWFGNSYANVALRLPISAYLIQSPTISRINTQRELYQLQLEESNKIDEIQQRQKFQKINSADKKVKSLTKIVELSNVNIEKQKIAYEAGRLLLSDYNKSISNHNNSLKDLWQAQYDLITFYLL